MKRLVIYHGGCRDGFCAAWVAHGVYGDDAEYFAGYYGQPPPDVTGRDVLIVDFSYPRAILDEMAVRAASLLVLDHHKTAQADLAGAPYAQFDMERSGAGLAWDHFNPPLSNDRPMLVRYVEDRDLWRNALPHTREVNAYISTIPFDFGAWSEANLTSYQDQIEAYDDTITAVSSGRRVLAKVDQYVAEVGVKNARVVLFEGAIVPCVNVPQMDISEVLDRLCQGIEGAHAPTFAMGWWQRADGIFQYSLRSRGDFDVSAIAKKYGGGGHKNAAGFQSEKILV